MLANFRNELEAKKKEIDANYQAELSEQQESPEDRWMLSKVLHAISEVGSTYIDDYFVEVNGLKNPVYLHIKIPPPAFFFIENGTPFILHSLALPPRPDGRRDTPKQVFDRQIRTCCACINSPKLTIDFLSTLPRVFIQHLYAFIIDLIAPQELIALTRVFVNKCKNPEDRMSILEVYLMSGKNSQSTVEYLFSEINNPYLKGSLEHIIFEIGFQRDQKEKQQELNAMAAGGMKRGFFG